MTASVVDIADLQDQCQRSIERSRQRRAAAEEWRRSRFRRRGGTASVAATGVLVAVGGSGAVGVDLGGAQPDASDGASESEVPSQARISTEGQVADVERTLEDVRLGARPGELTQAKLRRLQQKAGLVVDGIGGLETLAALRLPEPEPVEPAAQAPQPVAEQQPAPRPQAAQSQQVRASKRAPARRSNAGVEKAQSSSSGRSNSTGGGNVPAALQRIAQCESGGNPGAIGGGGAYRGKYQFSPDTWRSVGGSGDPAKAPEAEQDRRAAQLYARSGAGQWPTCGQ